MALRHRNASWCFVVGMCYGASSESWHTEAFQRSAMAHSRCENAPVCHASIALHGASCAMAHVGWLQLVGFLKLKVSFSECGLVYRALLQKRPPI